MKKKFFFFSLLFLILIIFFNKKILTYVFIKNISHATEYDANLNISKLDYISGKIEINQIKLKNKENFFYENIFESNQIIIDFDYKSLFSDLAIINKMTLIDPKFFFEIKNIDSKKDENIKITDNLNLLEIASKKNSPKIYPIKKKDKNFIILNLLIKNPRTFIKYPNNEENLDIDLSEMSFVRVGNATDSIDQNFQHFKDVLKIILNDIFFRIPDNDLRNLIKKNYKIK